MEESCQRRPRRTMRYLRMDPEEWERVRERAQACGLTTSRYIRETALGAVPKARPRQLEMEAVRQLARLGNNLNQLARVANQNEEIEREEELRGVLAEVLAAVRRLG
jgi:hypothetical protein